MAVRADRQQIPEFFACAALPLYDVPLDGAEAARATLIRPVVPAIGAMAFAAPTRTLQEVGLGLVGDQIRLL